MYKEVDGGIRIVTFMDYDLGYIDLEERTVQPSTTLSGQKCHLCLRNELLTMCPVRTRKNLVGPVGFEPTTNGL